MIGGKINLGQLLHVVQTKKGKTGDVECFRIRRSYKHKKQLK